jgi:hypothetical protein
VSAAVSDGARFFRPLHYNHRLQPSCKQLYKCLIQVHQVHQVQTRAGRAVQTIKTFFRHSSVLGCPGWLRVALVLPVCALLWLGVYWALTGDFS